jgi:hypothetical protein
MKEAEIEKILVCEVKKLGGRAYKWVSPGNAGVPDRIVILPGLPVPAFVELKTCRGTLTALQTAQINRLRVFGQKVWVVKGIAGMVRFFDDIGYTAAAQDIQNRYAERDRPGKDGAR